MTEPKRAQLHLPGLFEFYEFYRVFLPLYRAHREYFYDWCEIASIYGAPEGCIWGGGRVGCGKQDPRAVLALTQDKVDAVVIDREPAKAFVAENPGLKILDTEYAVEDYAIAVSKKNDKLLEEINTALEELIADGTVQSILDKYITAD